VAIVHDAQLNDDPELLRAAGAVALLASDNAELDAAWSDAVQELQRSRRRIVRAADDERRKFEPDLRGDPEAIKHGGPDVHVAVALRQDDGTLRAEVSDDGPGFDPGQAAGTGLQPTTTMPRPGRLMARCSATLGCPRRCPWAACGRP
jgi:hypothetical protein